VKVLWVGDSPTVSSGFARCTRAVCDDLHATGHDVHVLGINEWGDTNTFPYNIYTCRNPFDNGYDAFGVTRLPSLVSRLTPDVIVLLNDPWNIPGYFEYLDKLSSPLPPVIGWLAVDGRNQRASDLARLDHVVVWTEFARDEFHAAGYEGSISIVPLGVDTTVFRPKSRTESLARIGATSLHDNFIVGVVGRNQPRKRLDLTLRYFADWVERYSRHDARLFLHVAPTGDYGCDLRSLISFYKLNRKVVLSEPHIGHGVDTSELPYLYSAFDVYFTTTQGEGFGLPALEALACGVPIITPDWSALGSRGWCAGVSRLVPCTGHALTAPINDHPYTVGGIMDRDLGIEALEVEYQGWLLDRDNIGRGFSARISGRQLRTVKGISLARSLTWESSARKFRELLETRYGSRETRTETEIEEVGVTCQV
jgi:D-inositol-3-phosphate glycosyltransferase